MRIKRVLRQVMIPATGIIDQVAPVRMFFFIVESPIRCVHQKCFTVSINLIKTSFKL